MNCINQAFIQLLLNADIDYTSYEDENKHGNVNPHDNYGEYGNGIGPMLEVFFLPIQLV